MKNFSANLKSMFLLLIVTMISVQLNHAQKIAFSDSWNKAGFNLKTETRSGVTVGYSVNEFSMVPATINSRSMTNIELPGYWLPNDEGAPNLPGGGRYIAIPQGATPVLNIVMLRTEKYNNVDIAPAPRIPLDTETGPLEFRINQDIYNTNSFYPASPVKLSKLSHIRGVDVVMLGITPFQYNPVTKELIVYRDIEVEITFTGGNGQFGEERLRSRFWDPILNDALLNYQSLPKIDYGKRAISQRSNDGWEYLIIVPDGADFMTFANQIKSWRIKQGITTEIKTLTEIGGNNVSVIETYINNAYATWDPAPAAILLMADFGNNQTNNILAPIWDSYCASDNIYGDVDGDELPDIVMARMTANDASQLGTFVTKFLNYENNPPTAPDFYDHPITALGWQTERWFQICSETVGGYFKNVQGKNPVRINEIYAGNPNSDPWSTATNTGTILDFFGPNGLGYIPATPQALGGWSGGNATMINNAINDGAFILQHRDHGAETGWGEPAYSNPNIDGLTNTDLTFVFSINCLTGKYNWSSECFTEKFHRYRHNNVNSGALALIGASEVSYSFVNDTYVWGMFDNMWTDFMPTYGPMGIDERGLRPAFGNAAGKYFLEQSSWPYNSGDKTVTYHLFHHHGDAFLELYSEVPQDLTILHDGVILAGLNEFTITADAGSTICLTVGNNIIGLANGTGAPQVIDIVPQLVGTNVVLTVTKTNYFRHEETLQVIPATGAYCIYGSHTIHDTTGNNNGLPDYNETLGLSLEMKNVGMADAENVTVTISTNDPYVTIVDNTEFYGTIPASQSITIDNGFTVYLAENTPDQHQVIFNIVSSDSTNTWNSLFMLKVNAPVLNINTLTINDNANGNGNGQLDPGETVTMTINYNNAGHAVAYDVDSYLEGQSAFVEVLNPLQHFTSIGFFGVFNKSFDVVVDTNSPEGILVDFVNELTMGSYFSDKTYREKISAKIEDFETGDFTKYNWQSAGAAAWQITSSYPYQGNYSAKSGAISASQTSEIKVNYTVMSDDSIAFIKKVSSEAGDKLQFYIGNTLMGDWSGTGTSWTREAYPVTAGTKTFRWVYSKNGSGNAGADCGWLDNIVFPQPYMLTLWAGPDEEICAGETFLIAESYGTAYTQAEWTSSGTGTFNDNTVIHPVYTASDEDIANGMVTLTMTLWDDDGLSFTDEMVLSLDDGPDAPPVPQGPDYVDLFTTITSEYVTDGLPGLTQYAWYLDPADAGTIEGTSIKAIVTWNPAYLGMAYVSVAAFNDCGEGDISESFEVTVDNTVIVNDPDGANSAISVFPNPGTGLYNLVLENNSEKIINLRITNLLGETIYSEYIQVDGSLNHQLNLEALPDGIYFLLMNDSNNIISRKIVKK